MNKNDKLNAVLDCIEKHFMYYETTPAFIANECNMSVRTLYKLMKDADMQIAKVITKRRLQNAISLMAKGEKVYTAFMDSGFGDASSFYRNFNRVYGMSPREFMKKEFPSPVQETKTEIKLQSGTTIELSNTGNMTVKGADSYFDAFKELAWAYIRSEDARRAESELRRNAEALLNERTTVYG